MLVLDRRIQEGFWIDGRIFVKVLGIGRRRVKLGIDAPSDLTVVREELCSESSPTPGDKTKATKRQLRGPSGRNVGGA